MNYIDFKKSFQSDPQALKELSERTDRSWINPYGQPGQSLLMSTVIGMLGQVDQTLNLAMFNWLMDQGADLELTNEAGQSALYFAMFARSPEAKKMIHILLDRQENVSQVIQKAAGFAEGDTLLHTAMMNGEDPDFLAVVKRLIPKISVNAQNEGGETPLHCLLVRYHMESIQMHKMVELLVSSGADISLQDQNGDTALTLARKSQYVMIEKYLTEVEHVLKEKKAMEEVLGVMAPQSDSSSERVRKSSL